MTVSRQTCQIVFPPYEPRIETYLTQYRLHCQDDVLNQAIQWKDSTFLIILQLNFCMEMPHFEYSWLIGEEICLSRLDQFSFNIHPQLFLQEIAILFIYLLFIYWFNRLNRLWKWNAFHTIWQTFPFLLLYTH